MQLLPAHSPAHSSTSLSPSPWVHLSSPPWNEPFSVNPCLGEQWKLSRQGWEWTLLPTISHPVNLPAVMWLKTTCKSQMVPAKRKVEKSVSNYRNSIMFHFFTISSTLKLLSNFHQKNGIKSVKSVFLAAMIITGPKFCWKIYFFLYKEKKLKGRMDHFTTIFAPKPITFVFQFAMMSECHWYPKMTRFN